jgi:hypothetical protein
MKDDPELATITEAIRLRGLFIHRYSGIEFSVTELIMRARGHPAYNPLGDLPKPWDRKLKRLERLITLDGPIKAYDAEVRASLTDFESFEPNRHFLVHGLMTIPRAAADRTTLGFSMYDHKPVEVAGERKSIVHAGRLELTLARFDEFVGSLQPISTSLAGLVARICREVPLPTLREQQENGQ